ncbi:MAG: GlsB/YeaQ/YmgE family stress response membrane protein [Treponema sp.]|nr:GlsB/YeaQ/YmgE family stress response membrane protein [Treponema sp.]
MNSELTALILTILIGALIGYIASVIMKSKHGFIMSCILGIVGSVLGSVIFGSLGIGDSSIIWDIIEGTAGACILIAVVRAIMGKKF